MRHLSSPNRHDLSWHRNEPLTREYCKLVTKEVLLRLPAILPWRPGTFRRAIIGRHIHPDTLALAVMGNDDKIAYDNAGEVKRLAVTSETSPRSRSHRRWSSWWSASTRSSLTYSRGSGGIPPRQVARHGRPRTARRYS